jgi:hypothetical protein
VVVYWKSPEHPGCQWLLLSPRPSLARLRTRKEEVIYTMDRKYDAEKDVFAV